MREAAVVVGAAIVGVSVVLLSYAPARPSEPPDPAALFRPVAADDGCPCGIGPLEPSQWESSLAPAYLEGASALSLALADAPTLTKALRADDPAERELAALLLNVASGRVAGCTRIADGSGRVAAVLDRLDRLVAAVREGRKVVAADLATAAAAAESLNRGEGLPPGCGLDRR